MNRALSVIAVVAVCAAPTVALLAQEHEEQQPQERQERQDRQDHQPPEFGDPRFAFHRIDDGYLRLDMRIGDVAVCSQRVVGWSCTLVPDERVALDNEIARLQRDNALLKNALLERGVPLPNGAHPDAAPAPTAPPTVSAPPAAPLSPKAGDPGRASRDDADIDRIMNVIEKVWRRLVEMMADIQHDLRKKS